jgi:hypothetical protein
MIAYTRILAVILLSLAVAGCGDELIDSKARIQLLWGCSPDYSAATSGVTSYCLTVLSDPMEHRPTDGCAGTIEGLRIKIKASPNPMYVKIEGIDQVGTTIIQGISPPVVLDPESDVTVPVPMAPSVASKTGRALLLWGNASGCEPLPFPSVYSTATAFPSGHVLMVGTDVVEMSVDDTRAAYLLDTVAQSSRVLSTVGASTLYRAHHIAALLDDGRVLLAGGETANTGFFPQDLHVFSASPALMRPYDRAQDYTAAGNFNRIGSVELAYPRPRTRGGVFFGDQVLIFSDGDRPEMFFGDTNTRTMLGGGYAQAFPNTGISPGLAVFPDRSRALLLGGESNHAGRLVVSDGNPNVTFVSFPGATFGVRRKPIGIALDNTRAVFLGGAESATDTPILLVDGQAGTVTAIPAPPTFPIDGFTADLLPDGSILVCGGRSPNPQFLPGRTFILKPNQGSLSIIDGPSLSVERIDHRSVRLPDRRILLIGGITFSGDYHAAALSAEVLAF